MSAPDHVRYTQGDAFACLHCGAAYTPAYPLPLRLHRAMSDAWTALHRHCLPLRAGRPSLDAAGRRRALSVWRRSSD